MVVINSSFAALAYYHTQPKRNKKKISNKKDDKIKKVSPIHKGQGVDKWA